MFPALCCSLMFAAANGDERLEVLQLLAGIQSEFLGLTQKELVARLGEPTQKEKDGWSYRRFIHTNLMECRFVQFKDGKVARVTVSCHEVGCWLREPRADPPQYVRR